MAINFTTNIEQYTTTQKSTRAKYFMEFTSKKQLQDASILTDKELAFATSIKGTFSFALHNDGRYMAVTLYKANADRKYNFLILDLKNEAVAEIGSIKEAKAEILELVKEEEAPAEPEATEDEELANTVKNLVDEALSESNEAPAQEEDDSEKKSKKTNKTA